MKQGIKRYLWKLLNATQGSVLLPGRIRNILLRMSGLRIHPSAMIREGVYIGSRKIKMEKGVYVNIGCFLDGSAAIILREKARIGPHVRILTGTHTYANSVIRRCAGCIDINREVIVERGCWVGMGTTILPGVVIKEGCVIAANATVTKSTSANGLYAGTPAKRIKDLPVDQEE
jgi:maltose O-acetyltransferase